MKQSAESEGFPHFFLLCREVARPRVVEPSCFPCPVSRAGATGWVTQDLAAPKQKSPSSLQQARVGATAWLDHGFHPPGDSRSPVGTP